MRPKPLRGWATNTTPPHQHAPATTRCALLLACATLGAAWASQTASTIPPSPLAPRRRPGAAFPRASPRRARAPMARDGARAGGGAAGRPTAPSTSPPPLLRGSRCRPRSPRPTPRHPACCRCVHDHPQTPLQRLAAGRGAGMLWSAPLDAGTRGAGGGSRREALPPPLGRGRYAGLGQRGDVLARSVQRERGREREHRRGVC